MSVTESVFGRRAALRVGMLGLAGLGLGALSSCATPAKSSPAQARVEDTGKGTAGAVIRPITDQQHLAGNLPLSYVATTGPGDVQNKLLSGALDSGSMGPIGAVVANAAGANLTLYTASLNNHVRWLVPANSPYRTPADLRGKAIAAPPDNSDAYRSAQLAAAVTGIDFDKDYQVHQGAVLAGLALFDRGSVEAIVTIEPNATRLVGQGARQLATVDELWQQGTGNSAPLLLNGQGAREDWVNQHHDIATELSRLQLEVNQRIHDRPQVLADLASYYGVPPNEKQAIALLPQRMVDVYPTTWDQAAANSIDTQIAAAVRYGLLKNPPAGPVYSNLTT